MSIAAEAGGKPDVLWAGGGVWGAVMISAGFVHLLGTAIKELDPMARFPLAPFLCGLGFLVTLVADHLAETLSHRCALLSAPLNTPVAS